MENKLDKKVTYRKQIARHDSWSTLLKFSSHLVWSPCNINLSFLLLSPTVCAHVGGPTYLGDPGVPPHSDWGVADP